MRLNGNKTSIAEASRVWKFRSVCEDGLANSLQKLGDLMTQSHESLQKLYECSHPELDKLVQLSSGVALGARLTGAG